MPTNVQIIEGFYGAVAAGDLPKALATFDEAIEWHEAAGMPYAGEEPYRGPGAVVEKVLGPINADVENLRLEIREVIGLGAQVAALGTYTGTTRGSGTPIDQPFVHLWMLNGAGRASEFRQFTDSARFAAAIGG